MLSYTVNRCTNGPHSESPEASHLCAAPRGARHECRGSERRLRSTAFSLRSTVYSLRSTVYGLILLLLLGGGRAAGEWQFGDVITYPQGVWGDAASAGSPAELLVNNFGTVYAPTFGILEVGISGTAGFSMRFVGGAAVLAYLPASGPSAPLTADLIDPTSSPSGTFGGHVVALRVNIDFADAGFTSGSSERRFGDLTLCAWTPTPALNGLTVRQVLGTMNTALGGGSPIHPIGDLSGLAFNLNNSFFAGNPFAFAQDHLVIGAISPKLTAGDAAADDNFGISVSISGDTALIGAPGTDDGGGNSGSAYVYQRSGTTWTYQQTLTAGDPGPGDQFGYSVAISQDTAIIGAYAKAGSTGAAYVFTRSGTVWTQRGKLTASDAAGGDWFGFSVDIDGDTAVVGAYLNDDGGANSGSAYVFVRGANNVWDSGSLDQQAKLLADDDEAGDNFGYSVSISGDTAVVGSAQDDAPAVDSGSAYVFTRAGAVWTQQARLTASDAATGDFFGIAVALSGDTVLVGAIGNDDAGSFSGSAYVFTRGPNNVWDNGSLDQQAKLTAVDAAAGDQFGVSVSISGDAAVVGANSDDDGGLSSGSAYVYLRTGGVWNLERKLTAFDAATDAQFGVSVSVSGDKAIVGAYRHDLPLSNAAGSAYVFSTTCVPAAVVNDIVWDPMLNPTPWPNDNPLATTRSLRFTVTGPASPSKLDAIRVTMVDLMHPDPRNLTQYPPPSYATFDTLTHGTCGGAATDPNYNDHHCAVNADCLGPNNGITTDDGTCSTGPACTGDVAATNANNAQGSCTRWVGKPGTFYEAQGPPQALPYRASRLQCTPAYYDWKSEPGGLVTVVGAEIIPSSAYSVQAYASTCTGTEVGCTNVSAPVTMYTRRKGDLDDLYQTPSPDALTQANAIDVAQSVNAVKHILGAPSHVRAQMQPNLPELNTDCNVLDIVEVVDSLKRVPYAFPGPCPCPSEVTCGGSCTGCAGMCVKVCTSGNIGEPCSKNLDCGTGGVCAATGTCRDKCGRCRP